MSRLGASTAAKGKLLPDGGLQRVNPPYHVKQKDHRIRRSQRNPVKRALPHVSSLHHMLLRAESWAKQTRGQKHFSSPTSNKPFEKNTHEIHLVIQTPLQKTQNPWRRLANPFTGEQNSQHNSSNARGTPEITRLSKPKP